MGESWNLRVEELAAVAASRGGGAAPGFELRRDRGANCGVAGAQRSPSSERQGADQLGSNEHSVGHLGVPVEEFELDLDHVVEALATLVDVVVAAATAVHFAALGVVGDA